MKKFWIFLAVMMLSGALAQNRMFGEVASGQLDLVPSFGLSVSGRLGAENVIGALALRGEAQLATSNGGTRFAFGADALYFLRQSGNSTEFYFGGGLGLISGGQTVFGLRGIAGVEIPVQNNFTFVVEAQPTLYFVGGASEFQLGLTFGPRLYFR